ncbi:hypothetical protein ACB092_04G033200 [Castanea dentata]
MGRITFNATTLGGSIELIGGELYEKRQFELRKQLRSLETKLMTLCFCLDNIEALEKPSEDLNSWAEDAGEVVRSVEDMIDTIMIKTAKRNRAKILKRYALYFNHIFLQCRLSSKIKRLMDRLTKKVTDIGNYAKVPSSMTSWHPSQYSEKTVVMGFEDHLYEIKERFLETSEQRRCIISIVGMEGSGKTTLAESIYKHYEVADNFRTLAMVSISTTKHGAEGVLQDIWKKVKESDPELQGKLGLKEEPKQMLQENLRERYLIILDNIPMSGLWDDVQDAFPDNSKGSRIVITTRDMAVPPHDMAVTSQAGPTTFQYKLQLRSTDESWTLFTKTLRLGVEGVPSELKDVGRKIVMRCGGLPLAIVNMGKLLLEKDKTCEEWTRVLKELRENKEDQGPWSEISEKRDFPEQFAESHLMELIDRNMIQVTEKKPNGKARSCRLPVALRKHLSKALEDKVSKEQVNTASKSSSSLQQNRWIVDHYNNIDPRNTSFDHIHGDKYDNATLQASYRKSLSFMSFDHREGSQPGDEIGNFLQRCISCRCFLLLRVLDLERVFRPQLPKVLSKLVLLRYLGLRWTYLESLPSSISNLLKLQTLDVKHTYISTLPRSIWKMQRLRHLYLSENYRSRFGPRPRGVILTDLQTLWGAFVDEKSPVKDGLDTLNNLRKLSVACRCMSNQKEEMSSQLKAVAEWIQKLEHLQSLRLKSHDENNQPWYLDLQSLLDHTNLSSIYLLGRLRTPSVISEFPKNLIELTLSASALTDDPMQKLGELPKLRILQLFSESYKGTIICCPVNSFPELRVLKLWKLEELEDWIVLGGALPRLRDLEIRSCAKLRKLPDGLQHVRHVIEP